MMNEPIFATDTKNFSDLMPIRLGTFWHLLFVLIVFLAAACSAAEPTVVPTPFATVVVTATPTADPVPDTFRLTVLHNNDGESQLLNLGAGLEEFGGISRFAAAVDRERRIAQ